MSILYGKTALIIEDDAVSARVLTHLLTQLGMTFQVIWDGTTIAEELKFAPRADVIFLDLEMPVSNGYAVRDLINGLPGLKDVPVIAYTTHTSHLNQARRAGFDGLLGKPLDFRLFPAQVERILRGEPVWEVPV